MAPAPTPARALLPAALLVLALGPGRAAVPLCGAPCSAGFYADGGDCLPCPAGTFSSVVGCTACSLCRKCEGVFRYLRECSPESDAECTCKDGYRCSDNSCSRCYRSCGVGQENTQSGCQICRYGTFNDQPNGSCKNWTKCSENQVLEPGTAAKDVICKYASDNLTSVTSLPTMTPAIPFSITVSGQDLQVDMIRISLAVAGLLCIVFLLPSCICFSIWQKKKLHAVFKKMHTTPEQSIQEDACSCRFPEEEQGEYQDSGKSTEFRDLLEN